MHRNLDQEISERLRKPFAKNLRKPSSTEVRKYLRLAKGCPKCVISETWMKNMMNWDLYTHPRAESFASSTSITDKIALAMDWKAYMDKHQIYLSFYEWYYSQLTLAPSLTPISAPLISCPVQPLSLSDLGREIQKLKELQKQEEKHEKEEENCKLKHQQYHILSSLRIQGLNFKLKTLLDTGSDLNLLNKHVIPVAYWEKITLTISGL